MIIEQYVESFFESIPYSIQTMSIQQEIIDLLTKEYNQLLENNKQAIAFEKIVTKYNSLEKMLEAVNHTMEELDHRNDELIEYDVFHKQFKKNKRLIWLITILSILAVTSFIYLVINQSIVYLFEGIFFGLLDYYFIHKYSHKELEKIYFSVDYYDDCLKLYDRYSRRSINWMFLLSYNVIGIIFELINLYFNSKTSELLESIGNSLFSIEVFAFFFISSLLITRYLIHRIDIEKAPIYRKQFKRTLIFILAYWLIGIGIFYLFEKIFVYNISLVLEIIFIIILVLYNLTRMKNFEYYTSKANKIILVVCIVIATIGGGYIYFSRNVFLTQPYINDTPNIATGNNTIEYNDDTGIYTITNNDQDDFKILQLTDIHIGGSIISYDKDLKALKAVYALINYTKPDFVIVTGDLCFPVGYSSFSFNNTAPVMQFASFMRNLGIPWAFTYGNHDTESYAATDADSLDELYKSLSYKTSKNLLYPYIQPDIMGRNNQMIEIRNSDGTLNQALFLIDSNAYTGDGFNKYDYIHDDQVEWYKENILNLEAEEEKQISSMVFFHIPLQEYATAYELYENGSDEVQYYFGENGEKMINKVCCSDYPSKMFDTALELGSTKAFFCGHDHYNNMSLGYKGIRLTYGLSIDYLAMPGIARDIKQRGATLITVHTDSTYDISQIHLTDIQK